MLKLSYQDLYKISIEDNLQGLFEVTHNDLPLPVAGEKYSTRDYMEDDGRMYFICEFKDLRTNEEYYFNYIYHAEHGWEFPLSLLGVDEQIKIVDESVLNSAPKEKKVEPIVEKSDIQLRVEKLSEEYKSLEIKKLDISTTEIPYKELSDLIDYIDKESFSKLMLIERVLPIAIKYKTNKEDIFLFAKNKENKKLLKANKNKDNSKELVSLSKQLVDSLVERYDIKSYEDFTCPIIKEMAMKLDYFK